MKKTILKKSVKIKKKTEKKEELPPHLKDLPIGKKTNHSQHWENLPVKKVKVGKVETLNGFCRFVGVKPPTWYGYLKRGVVSYCGQTALGKGLIDAQKMLQVIRARSNDPKQYSLEKIIQRRIKAGYISIEEGNRELLKRRKEEETWKTSRIETAESEIETDSDAEDVFTGQLKRKQSEDLKQFYLAKQAKIKYLKEAGQLVDIKKTMDIFILLAINVRKAFEAIPDRVCGLYASMESPTAIKANLISEIEHGLKKLKLDINEISPNLDDYEEADTEEEADA